MEAIRQANNPPAQKEVYYRGNMKPDVPGLVCPHGCSYMACRGLALSPVKDALIITHGPVGCGYYAWGGLREDGVAMHYGGYCFSTCLEEDDIIFGAEGKLARAIDEAVAMFTPSTIMICSTCPVGLIGDDVEAVAQAAAQRHGIRVLSFLCEGFKNVPGFRLSNYGMVDQVMGSGNRQCGPYSLNIIGEFYTGAAKAEIEEMLTQAGFDIVCSLMGESTMRDMENGHLARLNLLYSDKPVSDIVKYASEKFGADWMEVNFFGPQNIVRSLRGIAAYFGDPALVKRTEAVIRKWRSAYELLLRPLRESFSGLRAVLAEDGFQTSHFRAVLGGLGIDCAVVGGREGASLYVAQQSGEYEVFIPNACLPGIAEWAGKSVPAQGGRIFSVNGKVEVSRILNLIRAELCFWNIGEEFGVTGGLRPEGFETDEHYVSYGGFVGMVEFTEQLKRGIYMAKWRKGCARFLKEVLIE